MAAWLAVEGRTVAVRLTAGNLETTMEDTISAEPLPVTDDRRVTFNREQSSLAALIFFMMVLNYLDRQALSVVAPILRKELGLTVTDYANAVNAFLVAYSVMYVGSGIVLDRIGYRLGLALFVGLWSIFSGLHSRNHRIRNTLSSFGFFSDWPSRRDSLAP